MSVDTLHFAAASYYWLCVYYEYKYINIPPEVDKLFELYGDKAKLSYLAIWNMVLQGLFFNYCFVCDVIKSVPIVGVARILDGIKDVLLCGLVFPMSLFLSSIFWALFVFNREFIFPSVYDKYIPLWYNHVMHTNILILSLIEMYTTYHTYPPIILGMFLSSLFLFLFLFYMYRVFDKTQLWPYVFLEPFSQSKRLILCGGFLVYIDLCFIAGKILNMVFWLDR